MRYGKGPLGALMDEYERASEEFIDLVTNLSHPSYNVPIGTRTDRNLTSINEICYHVLFAGYAYADAIRRKWGIAISTPERFHPTQSEFGTAFRRMLTYTEATLADRYAMTDDELTATNIPVRWSDHHDLEALLEHAIVHVLRHRRQIEYELRRLHSQP